jgi:two-component system, NarL family, invasion response regulator UvrY
MQAHALPDRSVRVMVVDDSAEFLVAARSLVESVPGYRLVAEAASGEEAVERFGDATPDIVLMDIRMAGMGGIEATREILRRCAGARVVLITSQCEVDVPRDASTCGALGVLPKDELEAATLCGLRTLVGRPSG